MTTAGAPMQLIITPYDNYGNVANITSLEALQVAVVAEGGAQGRSLKSTGDSTVIQVVVPRFFPFSFILAPKSPGDGTIIQVIPQNCPEGQGKLETLGG